jgi:hypothetical protein
MQTPWTLKRREIVTVEVHGQLLDQMSFGSSAEAEGYKQSVRRWAREKGVIVNIRSVRPQLEGPVPMAVRAV